MGQHISTPNFMILRACVQEKCRKNRGALKAFRALYLPSIHANTFNGESIKMEKVIVKMLNRFLYGRISIVNERKRSVVITKCYFPKFQTMREADWK